MRGRTAEEGAYVQAVRSSAELSSTELEAWTAWALQYADELDPITSRRATSLEYRDSERDLETPHTYPADAGGEPGEPRSWLHHQPKPW